MLPLVLSTAQIYTHLSMSQFKNINNVLQRYTSFLYSKEKIDFF